MSSLPDSVESGETAHVRERQSAPPLALALLIVAAAHALPLFSDFFLDDFFNLQNALEAGWSWSNLTGGFKISVSELHDGVEMPAFAGVVIRYFRPLFLASLLADHAVWGLRPFGFHLTDVLLHLGVVAALYYLLRELVPGRRATAWFGALLYGVMPFHTTVVGWVSGRTEQLPALAMTVGLWAWLRFGRTRAWGYYALSMATMVVGLLGKENAIVFPAILFAAWVWIVPRPRPAIWVFVPFVLIAAAYLVWRSHTLGGFPLPPPSFYYHSPKEPGFIWWAIAKSVCVFIALLTHLWLTYPAEMLLVRHPVILAGATLFAAAAGVWLVRFVRGARDDSWRRLAWFAVAWIVIALAPTAPIFVAPIYFYFPLAGIVILYLVIWQRLAERGRPRWLARGWGRRVVPIAVLVLFVGFSQVVNALFLKGSRATRSMFNQIVEAVGAPADGDRLFLIDTPWLAGYAKIALRFQYPDRDFEVHLLSASPYLLKTPPAVSRLEQTDERTFRITALGRPYLSGIDGTLASGDRPPDKIEAGQVLEAPGYRVVHAQVEKGGLFDLNCVRQFVFRFDEPLASPRNHFLRFVNGRFQKVDLKAGSN